MKRETSLKDKGEDMNELAKLLGGQDRLEMSGAVNPIKHTTVSPIHYTSVKYDRVIRFFFEKIRPFLADLPEEQQQKLIDVFEELRENNPKELL